VVLGKLFGRRVVESDKKTNTYLEMKNSKLSKKLRCKRSLKTKTIKNIMKFTCAPFNKKEKAACTRAFKKSFVDS